MRRVRFAIVLVGCLLTVLCVLFPFVTPGDNYSGNMWIGEALHPTQDYFGVVVFEWDIIAIEIGLAVLLSCVAYTATLFHRWNAWRYAGVALFLPLIVGLCFHLPWLITRGFTVGCIDYRVILSMESYLLIAFLAGMVLIRKQRKDML